MDVVLCWRCAMPYEPLPPVSASRGAVRLRSTGDRQGYDGARLLVELGVLNQRAARSAPLG
ncbi:MAG: hypothetical protein JWM02_1937 [Frankiales bacterium]|nr:hypothetical protein [Frankiales bacterium]